MLKSELKKCAQSIVEISNDLQLVIEDYSEYDAIFSWANEEQDEGVSINLDLDGNLVRLSINKGDLEQETITLTEEERRERAEKFLLHHYPEALKDLTFQKSTRLSHTYQFYYAQLVMDIPIECAGCFIDIDFSGNIVEFKYDGVKQIPDRPTKLISKERLMEDVQNRLDFKLVISNLYTTLCDVPNDGLRLVYELESFMNYIADKMHPTLTIIHEEGESEIYNTLPPLTTIEHQDLSIEEVVGISEGMEVIREVDMDEEKGVVWRNPKFEIEEKDLSINGFIKRYSENTVKARISKKTGRVRSFIWFQERSGNLQLTRESCYQKAIEFLQMIAPNEYQYLRLIIRKDENDDDNAKTKESFIFQWHNGHGIPINTEIFIVVNCSTGQIDHYSGLSLELEQLVHIPSKPAISKTEADEILMNHLDFELVWQKDYENETESYNLVYKACDKYSRKPIRYIDALSGTVISGI